MGKKINRTGEITYNKYGSKITIVKYNNNKDITVEFDNGYEVKTDYNNFKKASIKSPFCKSVSGIGFLGEGRKYRSISQVLVVGNKF
jgi:hypothetical protein